jgi:hypothetical protein
MDNSILNGEGDPSEMDDQVPKCQGYLRRWFEPMEGMKIERLHLGALQPKYSQEDDGRMMGGRWDHGEGRLATAC